MRKKVCIIFGGESVEHEISIISANSILNNIDKRKYKVFGIFISKDGEFHEAVYKINKSLKYNFIIKKRNKILFSSNVNRNIVIMNKNEVQSKTKIDIFFPMVHGTGGEDGKIQGLLELLNKPYVGCDVGSSSMCMDKILTKETLSNKLIRTTGFIHFSRNEWKDNESAITKRIAKKIDFPCFVKASNLGSSVGVYKIRNKKELKDKVRAAFKFSERILVEEAVLNPEEIEVSVLEDKKIIASTPGRVFPSDDFYSYNAKYVDGKSTIEIPYKRAMNVPSLMRELELTSKKVFQILLCSGMARVDFLFGSTKRVKKPMLYLSEVNTIPGFTEISMFPKLLNNEGLKLKKIIDILIKSAEAKFKKRSKIITDYY
ncbi:D-alanine--D-alanine ligase [bacterium]|jgi:D-alanine-D-alanine ligase|nr:D-alanine--D-alanine ligase [bacterium]MBT3795462.1 D-alanine--D-alanine ligase [bacterium]MBT4634117.1 D-alanine--D-alanine ligase [bacterium]